MKCTACGKDNPDNAQFCGICGASMSESDDSDTGTGTAELPMVSFLDAATLGFTRYVDFRGRSSRAEYWWWALFVVLVDIIAQAIDTVVLGTDLWDTGLLATVWELAVLIPSLALGARRLHDINRSGWWLAGLFGYILLIIPGLVMTVLLIIWACKRGDTGPNKYGPDPRQPTSQRTLTASPAP